MLKCPPRLMDGPEKMHLCEGIPAVLLFLEAVHILRPSLSGDTRREYVGMGCSARVWLLLGVPVSPLLMVAGHCHLPFLELSLPWLVFCAWEGHTT